MESRPLFYLSICAGLGIGGVAAVPPVIPEAVKVKVREKVDNGYTPGVMVAMVNADGRSYFGYGRVSHDPSAPPPDPGTLYEIASVTKTFTAVLLAELVGAGDVSLADTAGSFLPAGVTMPGNGGDAITLEQLANHSSGLPNNPPNLAATITAFDNQFANYTLADLYDFLRSYELPRAAGVAYEYSNVGMALLGHVLALSQGTDYETLLHQRVLGPLGLLDTAIELDSGQAARAAPGHHGTVVRPPFEMNSLRAAGGLKSSASDLAGYLEGNLGLAAGPIVAALAESHRLSFSLPGAPYDQALGWWRWDGGDIIQHGGDSFGSTAFVGVGISTGTGVVVLSNNRAHFPAGITDLGFHCLDSGRALDVVPPTTPVSDARLREVAGDYGVVSIEVRNGRPVMNIPGQLAYGAYSNNADGLAVADTGLSINMSFLTDPPGGDVVSMTFRQNLGALLTFARVRRGPQLSVARNGEAGPVVLRVTGEADRDYQLEHSADLHDWQPLGEIHIWDEPREDPTASREMYYRALEP